MQWVGGERQDEQVLGDYETLIGGLLAIEPVVRSRFDVAD